MPVVYPFFCHWASERRGLGRRCCSYVVCFDINGLVAINDISTRAGDLAILEALTRVDSVATDDMLVLRIGGDEFALVTGLTGRAAAQALDDLYDGQKSP